jgi:hypothetical protein
VKLSGKLLEKLGNMEESMVDKQPRGESTSRNGMEMEYEDFDAPVFDVSLGGFETTP